MLLVEIVQRLNEYVSSQSTQKKEYALRGEYTIRRESEPSLIFEGYILNYSPPKSNLSKAAHLSEGGRKVVKSARNLVKNLAEKSSCSAHFIDDRSVIKVTVTGSSKDIEKEITALRRLYEVPDVEKYVLP